MTTREEILSICTNLIDVMRRLELTLAEEIDLVRSHKYDDLPKLHDNKARLSKTYTEFMSALRDNLDEVKSVAPDLVERIRGRHDTLQIIIRDNMTAISAARAVSESLLGSIADEVQKKRQPITAYSSTGATQIPRRENLAIAVNSRY